MTMPRNHGDTLMTMKTIAAGLFKAKCLQIMDEVQSRKEPVLITKRGRPVAKLVPVDSNPTSLLGYMQGKMEIVGDLSESPWDEVGGADSVIEKWDRVNK